jgi:outer membrane protein TolC
MALAADPSRPAAPPPPARRRGARSAHVVALLALAAATLGAQPMPSPLDALVAEGLAANPGLRARTLEVTRDEAAVREAAGRWLPSATLTGRASELRGAVVDVGTLVNPAYAALNQLLGDARFPTDVQVRLPLRQEAILRLQQPLFEPRLLAAHRIARAARDATAAGRDAARRQLAADIRLAYLQFARAERAHEILVATVPLLAEGERVAERLLAVGKVTPDNVLRARAERSAVVQQRDQARQLADAARRQLNLLVGRPVDAPLVLLADSALAFERRWATIADSAAPVPRALATREELRQLDRARDAADGQARLARAAFLPSVGLGLDYGVQGNTVRLRSDRDFAVASVVLSWNLFNGGQDRARIEQARAEAEAIAMRRADASRQVTLQVEVAHDAARVAHTALATADDRLAAATRGFDLVQRRYAQGMAPQLELLDARTALTAAQLNRLLTTYDFYARVVELDRAAALTAPE